MPENTTISEYQSQPKPKKDTVGLTFTDPLLGPLASLKAKAVLPITSAERQMGNESRNDRHGCVVVVLRSYRLVSVT